MPGPEEQGYELEPSHVRTTDGVRGTDPPRTRDRPAESSAEDLQRRQDRLPPGHPSSRFNDDGTPKPPLVPLKNLELPEPGEEREHNGTRRALVAKDGQAESGPAESGPAESGPAESGARAVRPSEQEAAAPDSAVTKPDAWEPDVWASVDREPETAEPVSPKGAEAWKPGGQEQGASIWAEHRRDISLDDDRRPAQEHESPAQDPELTDDKVAEEPQPDHQAEAADEEPTSEDHEPIADDPAPAAAEQPEAKPAEPLSPEQVRIAVRAHGRCRLAEGRSVFGTYGESGLTPAMRRIEEQLDHGELVRDTEKYALKSLDRFQEKLAKQIARFPGTDATNLADDIHDGVRYTFIFDAENYVDGVYDTRAEIEAEGYSLIEMRPSWHTDEYKGVNSRWRDISSGALFEVQWHTPLSWEAKQKTHDAYEKIDRVGTSVEEVERLRDYQRAVCAAVPVPPGALEMRPYKKES